MPQISRTLRKSLLAAAAAALLALASPLGAAAADSTSVSAYGIGSLKTEWLAGYNGGAGADPNGLFDLDLMGGSNIKLYRARFRQDQVLVGGAYSQWVMLDNLVGQAAARDVTLLPILINMPGEVYTPPTTASARTSFGDFAAAAVRRYGPGGAFWATCGCTAHPIKVWEVWNEENVAPYWNPPSPKQYGATVKTVRGRIRAVDPTARILLGGLAYPSSVSGSKMDANDFLRRTISAAGRDRFDAVAVHTYDPDPSRAVNTLIKGTVDTLKTYAGTDASGAPRQQVWVNELGRPTFPDDPATAANEQALSEQAQSDWLTSLLDALLPQRAAWNLGPVMWYAIRDSKAPTADWLRLGLRRTNADDTDAGPKPSWGVYTTRSQPAPPLPLPVAR